MREISFALSHYLALGLFTLTSYIFGRRLLLKLKFDSIWEQIAFSIGLGMGIVAYLVFFLGMLGFLYPSTLLLVILACLLGCYPVWTAWFRTIATCWKTLSASKYKSLFPGVTICLVILIILLPILLLPLYPPTAFDATMYHLPYPKIYVQSHQIIVVPYLRFPLFPQINEMLFTLMLVYDDIAAQLTQFLMMLLVAVALYAWGHRVFSSRAGLWAAALWLGNPLVMWLGTSAYIDLGLTLFVTLGVYAFFNWMFNKERYWLVIAGAFTGLAMGSKYNAIFLLGAFVLAALYIGVRQRRWTYPAVFAIIAVCVAAPFYLRNIYYTGNPVFPFFGQVFGYTIYSPEDVDIELPILIKAIVSWKSLVSLLTLPWDLTFNPQLFNSPSSLSPIYFFTFPVSLLFGFRNRYLRAMLICIFAYTLFWFFTARVLRYLLPIFTILSLVTAESLGRLLLWLPFWRRRTSHALITALGIGLLMLPGFPYAVNEVRQQGPVPVTQEQRDSYLAKQLPSYSAYKFLNELDGNDYTVYAPLRRENHLLCRR